MTKNILIIGGTSGLGLELAKTHHALGFNIFITGRKDPKLPQFQFRQFSIGSDIAELENQIDRLISDLPLIHTLIYAAGYYQEGRIDALSDEEIIQMINVVLAAPALLIRRLKSNSDQPLKIMLITSSSQYTPRELEPLYTATKAGLGMLGNSLGFDSEIGKVLVAAPSGMNTPFWKDGRDVTDYLDPKWVAEQITQLANGQFKYKFAKILRNPAKVKIAEVRYNTDCK
jgi:short-subunit dehydrogenase